MPLTGIKKVLPPLFILLACSVIRAQVGPCEHPPAFYEINGYHIEKVQVDIPLRRLFGSVKGRLEDILANPQMPQARQPFSQASLEAGFVYLQSNFNELSVNPTVRGAFRISWPTLQKCDDSGKTLEVVYKVYTFGLPSYSSRVFEDKKKELSRAVVDTPATRRLAKVTPLPFVGYDRSRNLFGGTKISINQLTGPIDKIDLEGAGSPSSAVAKLDASGSQDSDTGFIRHKEWHLKYQYLNQPGETIELKQGSVFGQFSAVTRSFGTHEFILRFGSLIEGGNRQSDVDPARVDPTDVLDSRYRGIKAFIGGSLNPGRQSFKASYGVQVGSASEKLRTDFIKHLFDAAYSVRFLPWDHKPISIDSQFSAGILNKSGRLPISERFFGGNVEQNFIADESWIIRSNPYIRSFPQNRLETVEGTSFIGGDRFFSANLTVAATIWGYPLVPKEILKDPDFPGAVELEMSVAQGALQYAYLSDTPEFKEIAQYVRELPERVAELKTILSRIPNPNSNSDIQGILDELFVPPPTPQQNPSGAFDRVELLVNRIIKNLEDSKPSTADIETLAVGDLTDPSDPLPSRIEELSDPLQRLEELLPGSDASSIASQRQILDATGGKIKKKYLTLITTSLMTEAGEKAKRDMVYPRRVFNQMAYETNLIGISPVIIFDAAQIWRHEQKVGNVRYAAGGGLRVSFFNLDLTTIYAWNINSRPGEGRGALSFSFGISDFFR